MLTCLDAPAPDDAFRPAFGEPVGALRRFVGPRPVAPARARAPLAGRRRSARASSRARMPRPWIDNLFFGFDAQVEYMPMYGREVGRATGMASLIVMLDLPAGTARTRSTRCCSASCSAASISGAWCARGIPAGRRSAATAAAASGRSCSPACCSATTRWRSPSLAYPDARFGEDMHTAYVEDVPPPANVPTGSISRRWSTPATRGCGRARR